MLKHAAEKAPLRRNVEPREVGNTALFLCSPMSSAITGEVIYVDCGYNIMGILIWSAVTCHRFVKSRPVAARARLKY